jgi:hypothetical protein
MMLNNEPMKYVEKFEDEGFVYELSVEPSNENTAHLYTFSQGSGYYCRWNIIEKNHHKENVVSVTDDECELIIFDSVESAIKGAKDFLSMQP